MEMTMTEEEIKLCTTTINVPSKHLKENKVGVRIINMNKSDFSIVSIDGCIKSIQDNRKCDFAVYDSKKLFFIELKGSDVKHGIDQLSETVALFSSFWKNKEKRCILCAHHIPKASIDKMIAKQKFYKQHKIHLEFENTIYVNT